MQKRNPAPHGIYQAEKFIQRWGAICWRFEGSQNKLNQKNFTSNTKNFFNDIPNSQCDITDEKMICQMDIDWSLFTQLKPSQINHKDMFDCFHGILYYAFYYSNSMLNTNELSFHFSGAKKRQSYNQILNDPIKGRNDQWNILNLFAYENINSQFTVDCVRDAFFGFTFKRIKIQPIAYSIRSGVLTNCDSHLVSFVFEGYDEQAQKWDILDERININDLIPTGSFALFYTRTTSKSYSSFQIRQTEPGSNGFWGFKIAAVDVHGNVSYREDAISVPSLEDIAPKYEFSNEFDIESMMKMNEMLLEC